MTSLTPNPPLTAGVAIRHLFDQRSGLLRVVDPATGRSAARAVVYRPQRDGSLIACLSNADDLLDAIHGGGEVELSIPVTGADGGLVVIVEVAVRETRDARISSLRQPLAELQLRIRDIRLQPPRVAS